MASTMIESFFQRSLEDMVKGLRMQVIGETAYLGKALEEVRKELKSMDQSTKTVALQKLTYLNMLQGTDMSWAAFQIVEVMSMHRFSYKKLGYLAASQSFNEATDVLLLITNLLRKDFAGKNEHETSLGLECLSRLATSDLARDLLPEVFTMLGSTRGFVRKKAITALWRVFTQYPDAVRIAFKRLVEALNDSDPSVVNSAISVLCDLAVRDPKPYLPLAPELYKLLISSPNNWLCIKLVKILGVLAPLEPRLVKKIAEPISELMRKSDAKSLLFECVQTVTTGLSAHAGAVSLCVDKLKDMMAEDDTNLKYLCLRALSNLMPLHPWAVTANKEAIGICLSHKDPSIQRGALRLIIGMVSEDNVVATVRVLLPYAYNNPDSDSCNEVLSAILSTCSSERYAVVPDFSWYVSVLAEMARIPHCACGEEIGRQLIDIGFRVESAGGDVFRAGRDLLLDPSLLDRTSVHGLLSAAAWIAGEYVAFATDLFELVEALLQPRTSFLPSSVRAIYIQAVFKVFVYVSSKFYSKDLPNVESSVATDDDAGKPGLEPGDTGTARGGELGSEYILHADADASVNGRSFLNSPAKFLEKSISQETEERKDWDLEPNNWSERNVQAKNDWRQESLLHDREEMVGRIAECSSKEESALRMARQNSGGSLKPTIQLIEANISKLVTCLDVEVQERACNLLGLVHLVKSISIPENLVERASPEAQQAIALLNELKRILSVELGPVSVHAQGRVNPPEGLILENLDALGVMTSNQETMETATGKQGVPEWEAGKYSLFQGKGKPSDTGDSTFLLAQHRQRHQSFYLPSESKSASDSSGYPSPLVAYVDPATRLPSTSATGIAPLLDDSSWSTKPSRPRAKPVVVKLDDEDDHLNSSTKLKKKKDIKDDFISSAIMDVLAGSSRSAHKHQTAQQGSEVRESSRTRPHRSHSNRSSRNLARENSSSRSTSSANKDKLDHSKSAGRQRHKIKALLSSPEAEDDNQPLKHPLDDELRPLKHPLSPVQRART